MNKEMGMRTAKMTSFAKTRSKGKGRNAVPRPLAPGPSPDTDPFVFSVSAEKPGAFRASELPQRNLTVPLWVSL